jgi:flagellar assembly protein FliH
MPKNLYRPNEVEYKQHKVFLKPPEQTSGKKHQFQAQEVGELEPVEAEPEEYTGPTADQLRREAEEFKQQWEQEKQEMIDNAEAEAKRIVEEAEEQAFRKIREKTEEANTTKQEAENEAERTRQSGEQERERLIAEAEERARKIEQEARERGYQDGHEAGIQDGKTEVQRVIERFHVVLSKAIERRNEIIRESESQVISLVLSIAKKVIKVISENQRNVVINNIVQSLKKLQQKSDVIVRVNLDDLKVATRHKEDILKMAERVQNITIAEDSTIDKGGCIIETDFGEIDARIASQLREIEDRIVELSPIKATPKSAGGTAATST